MIKKKKIAFYIHDLNYGGAERVVTNLANSLCEVYEVFIITDFEDYSVYPLNEKIKRIGLKKSYEGSKSIIGSIYQNIIRINSLTKICKKSQIGLLIGFTTNCAVLAILASKILGLKSIISERNNPIVGPPDGFWTTLRNLTYPFASLLIVQSNGSKKYFSKLLGEDKIVVITNPISDLLDNSKSIKRQKKILNVGRLDQNKAQDILIRAFANIDLPDWELVLVGDGIKKNNYEKLAKTLGVDNRVSFVGRITDVQHFYQTASIFAFTSRSEGMPNALMEALYFGLPSISTDCDFGPSDLITNGANGFLIEVDNQTQLEKQIMILAKNPDLRKKISQAAKESSYKFKAAAITKIWKEYIDLLLHKDLKAV